MDNEFKIGDQGMPSVPGVPSVPGAPSVPGMPSEPGMPVQPGVPIQPNVPGMPVQPGAPSVPGAPSMPVQQGTPIVPTGPGAPIAPDKQNKPVKQGSFFYGWWIVAGGFLIMATCYTMFVNCIPLFQAHIAKDLEISIGEFNTGVALCTVIAIFASLVIGALLDKRSARVIGSFTVITSAIILMLFSFITELWHLYALCLLAGMIAVAGTRLLVSVLATNWFTLRRGLAISIGLAGSGFGGALLSPITSTMIEVYSWRMAFLLLSIICLVAALPITILMFRNRPSDIGLEPYGVGQKEADKVDRSPDIPVTVSVGWKVLRKRAGFWLLVLGFIAMGVVNGAVITNAVTNMTSVIVDGKEIILGGHTTQWAGYVWSAYLITVIVAKIAMGAIYDRFGLVFGTLTGTIACVAAGVALCFPATTIGPILVAVLFGYGTCMGTVCPPLMVAKEYGKKDMGTVTGIVTAFEMLGVAAGALVSGLFFNIFETFIPAWLMVIAFSVIMGVTLHFSIPAAKKIVARQLAKGAPQLDAEGFEIIAS